MNIALISLVFTIVINLLLGVVVFLRNPKQSPNKALLFSAFSLSAWSLFNYLVDNSKYIQVSQYSAYLTFGFGLLSISSLLLFTYFFPVLYPNKKWHPAIFWTLTTTLFIICSSPLVVGSVSRRNETYVDVASGPLYLLFVASLLFYFILICRNLLINYKSSKKNQIQANQSRIVLFSIVVSLALGILASAILPMITKLESSKVGPLFTVILVSGFSVAIIKHKLFDIRLVVARSLTYLLAIGLLATSYGFIAFQFANIFISNWSLEAKETFYVLLAIILALTYAPLIRFFGRVTNKIFYRDRYDAQKLINDIGQILAGEIDLDKVSNKVLRELTNQMKIDKAEIVVFGDKQLFYENNVFTNNQKSLLRKDLKRFGRNINIADSLQDNDDIKQYMRQYGIGLSLALKTSEKFIGYLLLGEKKSGEIYNDEDIRVLNIIGSELSVAVQNALSFKEIQLFNETLSQKVKERTSQLKNANDQLKELDQAKDEFISMASHQLRTPLTTVKGYTSMLEEGDFGKLTQKQKEPVLLALDGANRMARLIDDLLNVSRMDANRFFLEVSEVDIKKLVQEELQQLSTMAKNKKVAIKYEVTDKNIPKIRLDETKTRQVIMNLVDNAIHYSQPPKGGAEVQVELGLENDNVIFKVIDNGIGVPIKSQSKLFTKMFRADNAKEIRPDGTGLGLYLVKRVVQDEGGEIIFESTEGKGSTFGFKLPISGVPKSVELESKKISARVAASHKS